MLLFGLLTAFPGSEVEPPVSDTDLVRPSFGVTLRVFDETDLDLRGLPSGLTIR